jgi:hypothetical protein
MSTVHSPCRDDTCVADSGDFARVRYFFGQRLTAVDLADEQAYLVGKMRFHHRHLHGCGVVCGLTAERPAASETPDGTTRMLRVHAGVAVDCHGREIVVPADHCIDVGAWYGRRRTKLPDAWQEEGTNDLWVAVRYRDCPSDPVRAPRDPCGCTVEGCEYGRVREGFQLELLTDLEDACTDPPDAEAARRAISGEAALACPPCGGPCPGWLVLAKLTATLSGEPGGIAVSDIGEPDDEIPERLPLLPTWALQALAAVGSARQPDLLGPTPTAGAPVASGTLAAAELRLPVQLVPDGPAGAGVPLVAGTVRADLGRVQTLDAGGWKTLGSDTAYDAVTEELVVTLNEPLVAATTYRLALVDDPAEPAADERLRPLAPSGTLLRFTASEDAGVLVVTPV